jgi:hypothetical protein
MSDLECSVCFYQYNDGKNEPKVLPCSGAHELCLTCLDRLRIVGTSFLCPTCRENIPANARINTNRGLLAALALMRVNAATPDSAATALERMAIAPPPSSEPAIAQPTEPAPVASPSTGPAIAQPAEPARAAAPAAPALVGLQCSACKQRLARGAFSRAQLGKSASSRRCTLCVNGVAPTAPHPMETDEPNTVQPPSPPTVQPPSPPTVQPPPPPTVQPPPPLPTPPASSTPPTPTFSTAPTRAPSRNFVLDYSPRTSSQPPAAARQRTTASSTTPPTEPPVPIGLASSRNFALDYSHPAPTSMRVFSSPATPLPFQRLDGAMGPHHPHGTPPRVMGHHQPV